MTKDIEVKFWEDESGKPVLNLIPLWEGVVRPQTQDEYDQLMKIYESGGVKWTMTRKKPTEINLWPKLKGDTCITANFPSEDKDFTYGRKRFFECENKKILSVNEYIIFQKILPDKIKSINRWFEKNAPYRESSGHLDLQTYDLTDSVLH